MVLNYREVLETGLFTFLLGPEEVPLQIHAGLVKDLSEPLQAMMTNGMKESVERKAKLNDVDPHTFSLFAEYAYTGIYRLTPWQSSISDSDETNCVIDGARTPSCCKACGKKYYVEFRDRQYGLGYCTPSDCHTYHEAMKYLSVDWCNYCGESVAYNISKSCPGCESTQAPGYGHAFVQRKYDAEDMNHDELRGYLSSIKPPDDLSVRVASHACLYNFADRFMVKPLQKLCLHKLHRDLSSLKLDDDTIIEVVELMEFTCKITSSDIKARGGHAEDGVGKDLRDLVIAYASWKAEELVKYDAFKTMLAGGGELVAELFTQVTAKRATL